MLTPAEKYRIVQRLGQQQRRKFGEVFLVEDKTTGEQGVMKMVAKSVNNSPQEACLREEITFHFHHPQLPATLFQYESDSELVVVRSFAPGVPLGTFLNTITQKQKPIVLFRLLHQLQSIFSELEKEKVVHLDIKPSNLIINGTVESFTVHLIDFGLSIRRSETVHRSVLFPLGYAAPELLLNRLHLADSRTDLFALGIVLWQAFTGKLPLLHPNPSITTNLQLTHPLPEHPALPKRYYTILQRMCSKHSFAIPPNRLTDAETDRLLQAGMDARYSDLSNIIQDWETALAKKNWLGW